MEHPVTEICLLMRSFVEGKDRSPSIAGQLEVALDRYFPADDQCQDLVLVLASYRPGGGEYLYDERAIAQLCEKLLERLCSGS